MAKRAPGLLGILILASACATPVGVKPVGPEAVHRTLSASAISTGTPSSYSVQVLQRFNLRKRFEEDPAGALAALHGTVGPRGSEDQLFALAELSFLHAGRTGSRTYYFATVAYAYAFLVPEGAGNEPRALDPRTRDAADLYNRALTEAFQRADSLEVVFTAGRFRLPFGELVIAFDPSELTWAGRRLERFVSAAKLEVRGLRNRYREAGIGAPLAASLGNPVNGALVPAHSRIPPVLKVPITAFLRLDGARRDLLTGQLSGRLELYSKDAEPAVSVAGRDVQLEYEPSAALANTLEGARIWDSELRAFLRGDYLKGGGGELYTLTPYRPGHIPVVLVHGTASSPARWADLVNELDSDRRISSRGQFWLFTYNTGNPILYSAALLRQSLEQALAEMDPAGQDPALRRMVVIGHSQGGLLTKLAVVDSGTRFWDNISSAPFETVAVKLSPETQALARRSFFITPLPFVTRVVFVATPHRGSEIAGVIANRLRRLLTWGIDLPPTLIRTTTEVLTGSHDLLLRQTFQQGMPRSVDNMSPGHRLVRTLASLPVAPGVTTHSIIAVKGDGPPEQGGDGIVAYASAHLDGAASERVVRSGHSVQSHPEAIEEIRRILLEHLAGS